MQDKSRWYKRADELLADLKELEDELDRADNSHATYFKTTRAIEEKRKELDGIRKIIFGSDQMVAQV